MQGAKPIRSLPLQAQAVAGRQTNLPVNSSSEDSTLCLSTQGNLGVNSTEGPSTVGTLYRLTSVTLGLTTMREGKRVSGSGRHVFGPARAFLVNTSRDFLERGT